MDYHLWFEKKYGHPPPTMESSLEELQVDSKMQSAYWDGYHIGYEMAEKSTLKVLLDQIKGVNPVYIKEVIQDMLDDNGNL